MKLSRINNAVLVWGIINEDVLSKIKETKALVIVAECRPYLFGLKHNIVMLKKEGVNFVYCPDNALGLLFWQKRIKKTVIFCNKINNKEISGRCGSLYVTLLSKMHNILIEYFLEGQCNFDLLDKDASTLEGRNFILEENKQRYIIEPADEKISDGVLP